MATLCEASGIPPEREDNLHCSQMQMTNNTATAKRLKRHVELVNVPAVTEEVFTILLYFYGLYLG